MAPVLPHSVAFGQVRVHGWGGGEGVSVSLLRTDRVEAIEAAVDACRQSGVGAIARGMGRSYGDAAQIRGGVVIDASLLKGCELDEQRGIVMAEAGATIGELLGMLVPAGWMLPVLPGTQHVTIGGAIASDIHGKNHASAGTIGAHVQELGLMGADGEIRRVTPARDAELLAATVGGMGLTGVILWARIALRRLASPMMTVDTDRVETLEDALSGLSAPGGSYRVAWLDLLANRPGRGIVTRAEHLIGAGDPQPRPDRAAARVRSRVSVPARWPQRILRPASVRALNELRFLTAPRRERGRPETLGRHMFPLDALAAWPRLYGREGLLQYQFAVPRGAERTLEEITRALREAGVPCYLAVLKGLGSGSGGPLSFPIEGWTLALDIPRRAFGVESLLRRFDEIVAEAAGRVYLTKDARLGRAAMEAMYPRLDEWRALRSRADPEGVWRSDLALRTGLVAG